MNTDTKPGTTQTAAIEPEPREWLHKPPTCQRCGARMRFPRVRPDGWTWGAFGYIHDCSFHR